MPDYIVETLFILLRLGGGFVDMRCVDYALFKRLSKIDWVTLKEESKKQGVSILILDGLNEVVKYHKVIHSVDPSWWKEFLLEWMGSFLATENENRCQIATMRKMAEIWNKSGCRVMVMKGQVNGLMYPNPLHRSPGDIDCYLFGDYALGNDIARLVGAKVDEGWYKHSQIYFNGELFENHLYFVQTREGRRSKRLQLELEHALDIDQFNIYPNSKIVLPSAQWNAMFLTYHACSHFLIEGLRMKQILDWAMFLKKEQKNVDWKAFYGYCDRYHFRRFADAITVISVNYLGVKVYNSEITTESPYAEKILKSTLFDGDYIYNAGESVWKSRWHVIRSLFKYRWKYEEIYQESIWKQLWWYASGYFFKTE